MQVIFFSGIAQKSKYSNNYLELPSNFLFESLLRKVQKYVWKAIYRQGGGGTGEGVRVKGFPLVFLNLCIRTICIQFPHDIQLHMEFCCMRKNSSNKLYTGTGAWVITEQTTNKETKKRLSIQQENWQKHKILWYRDSDRKGFGVNLLESNCETKNVVSDDTFTKSDRENAGKKMATVWKS